MTNLKFLHFPVAAKAVLLIAALGLLSIAANWFCLERLDEIDRLNATVTNHLAPARLALAEAKAASESFGVAVYKGYSASDPDQVKESAEEIEGQYNAARRALNNVLAAYPAASDDVHRMFEKLELAHAIAAEIGRSVSSGRSQQAERLVHFKFDPARDDVTGHMDRLINILGAKARNTEAEVAAYSGTTYRTTIAILGGGTAAALLVAFLLTQYFITRPLRRMARAMSLMAGGDLAVPVAGDRRGDEIGAMARAVAVFRNNAMALRDTERSRAAERARAESEKSAALEAVADAFEREIMAIADTIGHAAAELESFARGMTTVIDESHRHARAAAIAAEGSSEGATRVASAIEELSASIAHIGAQVANPPTSSRRRPDAPTAPSPIRRR
jgi:methyl-accepting chemotaxis protein